MHVPVHHVEHKEVHHESKGGLINDLTAKAKDVLSDTKLTTESLVRNRATSGSGKPTSNSRANNGGLGLVDTQGEGNGQGHCSYGQGDRIGYDSWHQNLPST